MISLLITLLIVCLVAGIVWWALQQIPLPAPVRMIVVVVFALILILVLLSFLPGVGAGWRMPLR
jgi:uncharacterized membrane protein YwzB